MSWDAESFCYLTTRGRRTGQPHTIEIWFGVKGTTVYLLSGGGMSSDWVKNLVADPVVTVRVGRSGQEIATRARVVADAEEEATARRLLVAKYQGWREGQPLSSWGRAALPVALDLAVPPRHFPGLGAALDEAGRSAQT